MVLRVIALLFLVTLALLAVALISVLSAERGQIRLLSRGVWVAVIVLLPVAGPVLYLWLGRPGRTREPGPDVPARPRTPNPDDDPDFLRGLGHTPPKPAIPDDVRPAEDSRTKDDRPPTDG